MQFIFQVHTPGYTAEQFADERVRTIIAEWAAFVHIEVIA